ncbi:MAG: right-handed parallel beta-helix repeat-containing protein [Planctomycetota bacterium]|nr:right-handed parallel beta-helix repeat-containing protein [Planctomycetota bacterium]
MDPHQYLISWLRSQSLVNDTVLAQAVRIQFHNPKQHLFQILVQLGAFTEDQGRLYYSQATQAYQSQSIPISPDTSSDVTLRPPLQTTPSNPSTDRPIRPVRSKSMSHSSGSFVIPVFEKYEIDGEISRGGMGVVFRARYKESSLEVALKVILDQAPPEEEVKRFRREAQTLAQIQHPGVVRVRDFGESEGRPYFAMDLIQGQPLKSAIDSQLRETGEVPSYSWTVKVFSEIAAALVHCHDLNIIHRDIKPANILLSEDNEQPVIVDFGLVKRNIGAPKADMDSLDNLTNSQATLGTPAYMAPEQFDRQGPLGGVDKKSDVWGFGATLYYALTGQAPYTGETVFNIYKALLKGDPAPPNTLNPEIPDELNELCVSCLTRNKSLRPSMRAIENALRQPLSDRSLHKKRSWQMRLFLKLGAVFIVLAVAATLAVLSHPQVLDDQAPNLTLEPIPPSTGLTALEISGTITDEYPAGVEFHFGRETETLSVQSSTFSKTVPLKIGLNRIRVRAFDENGQFSIVKTLEVRRIFLKPILNPIPNNVYESTVTFSGTVPKTYAKIECNGIAAAITGDEFSIKVPLRFGANELRFLYTDTGKQSYKKVFHCRRNDVYTVGPPPLASKDGSQRHFTNLQDAIKAAQKISPSVPIPKIVLLERKIKGEIAIRGRLYLEGVDKNGTIIESKDETCFSVQEGQVRLKNLTLKTTLSREVGVFSLRLVSGQLDAENCQFLGGYDSVRLGSEISVSRSDLYPSINFRSCTIEGSICNGIYARFKGQVNLKNCLIRGHREAGLFIELTRESGGQIVEHRDSTIEACIIEKNGLEGCEVNGCAHVTFRNTKFRDNRQEGILADSGEGNTVVLENCQFDRNGRGSGTEKYPAIFARSGGRIQLESCQIRNNFDEAIYCSVRGSSVDATKCLIVGGSMGVKAYKGGKLRLKECTLRNCKDYGITLDRCDDVLILNCTIENCKDGLYLKKSHGIRVDKTQFLKNRAYGIKCKESSSINIESSQFINNSIGISASNRSRVTYRKCLFKNQKQLDKQAASTEAIKEVP